jgi:hypothetical protein
MTTEIRKQYSDFLASQAGEHLVDTIDKLIEHNHNEAEKQPELSRDYSQRAKGAREIREGLVGNAVELRRKSKQ